MKQYAAVLRHGRLRAASLLEAIVAAVLFLTVFAAVMELPARIAVRDDKALLRAEADYRIGRAFDKYGSEVWPPGEYTETYDWGTIRIRIEPYRDFTDLRVLTVAARIDGRRRQLTLKRLIVCRTPGLPAKNPIDGLRWRNRH